MRTDEFDRIIEWEEREENVKPEEHPARFDVTEDGDEDASYHECEIPAEGVHLECVSQSKSCKSEHENDGAVSFEQKEWSDDQDESADAKNPSVEDVRGIEHHKDGWHTDQHFQENEEYRTSSKVSENSIQQHDQSSYTEKPVFDWSSRIFGLLYRPCSTGDQNKRTNKTY